MGVEGVARRIVVGVEGVAWKIAVEVEGVAWVLGMIGAVEGVLGLDGVDTGGTCLGVFFSSSVFGGAGRL